MELRVSIAQVSLLHQPDEMDMKSVVVVGGVAKHVLQPPVLFVGACELGLHRFYLVWVETDREQGFIPTIQFLVNTIVGLLPRA